MAAPTRRATCCSGRLNLSASEIFKELSEGEKVDHVGNTNGRQPERHNLPPGNINAPRYAPLLFLTVEDGDDLTNCRDLYELSASERRAFHAVRRVPPAATRALPCSTPAGAASTSASRRSRSEERCPMKEERVLALILLIPARRSKRSALSWRSR